MSAIPPNVIGSVLQSGPAQLVASQEAESADNAKASPNRAVTGTISAEDIIEIESTDADTQVHADSGGTGSQGRFDAEPEQEEVKKPEADGITVDATGQVHIDLSA